MEHAREDRDDIANVECTRDGGSAAVGRTERPAWDLGGVKQEPAWQDIDNVS
jgi:hypothetical protein